jgi:glycosyltransferase involved in cell wall biosynthesis
LIDISLIICTLNRASSLTATLESVTQAIRSAPDLAIEVVLVDNGSNDNTQEIVTGWKSRSSFPVIIVQEFQRGLSHARNAGLRASSGDIIAFTDDDCTLNADYFAPAATTIRYRRYDARWPRGTAI